ncbi:uncharacterized protein buc2l [Colossoma macropomum]|uniref:uncharacterized protein buc2l n=1 Tax=Colossoma macropomum TaxID=42526 RepID=UPI00186467D0|nr:uncharacterized protein buc2l [Colossoma macropomum]
MVVAAPQHPAGVGPQAENIPHGPPPVQGPRPPVPGSFRGPYPDRQQQQNGWPFFCVPPSQPYLPYQWPMPVPYVPYGGFPGMGYGMVVQPFPPASYVEPPGYILPHAQLHMADYRRMMAPHLAPAMAYQARRFRYQHTTPSGRVMVSSEVQTEPVGTESPQHDCKGATSSQTNSESGRGTASSSNLSSPKPHADTSACPEEAFGISSNKSLADTVDSTSNVSSVVPNSEIVFQAEEVRIECSGTRAGLKLIHAKETTELASSGELLQCNMGSVHSAEDVVLRCYQPLAFGENKQREPLDDLNHSDEQYLPACPDILMTGACPSSGSLEGSDSTPVEPGNSTEIHTLAVQGDPSLVKGEDDFCGNSKNLHFKILRLPFDLQCLDELRQMEASVWSVESLVPYVPSTEWMIQNGLLTPQRPSLTTVMEVPSEVPLEASQPAADAASTPQENLQAERAIELDGQDSMTSLESLPPYLPAASWLADFSNVYYSKLPSNVQQVGNLRTWPEGQRGEKSEVSQDTNMESSVCPKSGSVQFKEPRSRHRSRTAGLSPSHQDGCPVKSHLGMLHSPEHKVRICKSCLMKQKARNISGSPSPNSNCVKRHKVAHSHSTGDKTKVHLCAVCMCDPEKKSRCKASVDGETTEGEVSENSLYPTAGPKKRVADGQKMLHNNSQKVSSGRHSEKCPMARQSKLREQNCSCEGPKGVPSSAQVWDSNGYGQHNDLTLEKNEINMALYATERWRDTEQRLSSQKQKEKSWKGGMQVSDTESTKSAGKIRTHKQKQYAPTPELHRRDTRC